jgi:hypothetical protein
MNQHVNPGVDTTINPILINDSFRSIPEDKMGTLIEIFHDYSDEKCFSIYRQDAGMGEHDYCVLLNDAFLFRAEHHKVARNIVMAIRNLVSLEDLRI